MLYALPITCTVSGQFYENVLSNTIATHYIISVTHSFTTYNSNISTMEGQHNYGVRHVITKAGES